MPLRPLIKVQVDDGVWVETMYSNQASYLWRSACFLRCKLNTPTKFHMIASWRHFARTYLSMKLVLCGCYLSQASKWRVFSGLLPKRRPKYWATSVSHLQYITFVISTVNSSSRLMSTSELLWKLTSRYKVNSNHFKIFLALVIKVKWLGINTKVSYAYYK